jgi:acyl-coenzyme A synthetase/AMP-(fatty) acid ligase/aryl carrier-like protein
VVATSGAVAADASADASADQPSIGRPIAGAEIFILDDSLRPVAAGEAGELCIAGALVGRGYRNNPELTASRFVEYLPEVGGKPVRIYRTGDRARLLENGEIAFLGRLDDQVKIRGYRIELGEIVARLDLFPGIEASAVIVSDSAEGPSLVAYVVGAAGTAINASDLREFLAAKLPDYMIPSRFVALKELPMTANGKLDKSALPAPTAGNVLAGEAAAVTVAAPAEARGLQKQIAEMVATLVGQPTVQPQENFFMIGGHSMLGVQLVARIRDMFGVKLTLRQLFGAPTVAMLSTEVGRLTEAKK